MFKSAKFAFSVSFYYIGKRLSHIKGTAFELISSAKCFEGEQRFYIHYSETVKCEMNIGVYLPPRTIREKKNCPVLYFLEGFKSSHNTFVTKSGFQRYAAREGICVVCPDTSPRDVDIPKDDTMGPGASFYVDAIQQPWATHYQMFSYVTKELIALINNNLPVINNWQSISGFSMGGYGALITSLKNPGMYQSVSAFCPACNPMKGGLAKTVLDGLIGSDEELKKWDPCFLVVDYDGKPMEVFIDQGTCDHMTKGNHLLPENFVISAAKNERVKAIFKKREGYDHSHYFVSTFIEEHIKYHAEFLYSK